MTRDTFSVRALRVEELDRAAETLAVAFEDYPWMRQAIPSSGYRDRLRKLQRLYLEYALEHGLVATAGESAGVIALLPPDAPPPSAPMVQQIIDLHGGQVSASGASHHWPTAWRVETLGVRPADRGRGMAGRLIEHALTAIRNAGASAVVLETSDERNCRLYARHGFGVVSRDDVSDPLSVWTMLLRLDDVVEPAC
ncbi:ribosomal protein S18 acetylase RimI-like enzyme [Microbacterium sp. SORGH_AS428]|uniref:GNAT family N-acetyltransferase n=1 Tax=Microbacterium sp. SORGH_AS_0428 TaxID=3041788 RepID=UPI00285F11F5|nr:GNAT family N-acetyltransferase [Microbacterium sp. SORGH_AS_0428]MDR6200539.1 ribosomal protein S18 acetylase RimI-like enzyme [Microbacterium sp. SORGH_AS_0428]